MRCDQMSKEQLFNYINMVSFAKDDCVLYLDTHPCDMDALEYFNSFCKARREALDEYARQYGPLTIDTADVSSQNWEWINNPWPWEYQAKGGC